MSLHRTMTQRWRTLYQARVHFLSRTKNLNDQITYIWYIIYHINEFQTLEKDFCGRICGLNFNLWRWMNSQSIKNESNDSRISSYGCSVNENIMHFILRNQQDLESRLLSFFTIIKLQLTIGNSHCDALYRPNEFLSRKKSGTVTEPIIFPNAANRTLSVLILSYFSYLQILVIVDVVFCLVHQLFVNNWHLNSLFVFTLTMSYGIKR